ncbi:hypothetical protein XAB3213_160014 [Xanthomonas citri pv. bilvae]|nr:hypothetical protein XAB3213_160014 [Xanthomonas citri pv. bilvae]
MVTAEWQRMRRVGRSYEWPKIR